MWLSRKDLFCIIFTLGESGDLIMDALNKFHFGRVGGLERANFRSFPHSFTFRG